MHYNELTPNVLDRDLVLCQAVNKNMLWQKFKFPFHFKITIFQSYLHCKSTVCYHIIFELDQHHFGRIIYKYDILF